jgi:hypothetical protein
MKITIKLILFSLHPSSLHLFLNTISLLLSTFTAYLSLTHPSTVAKQFRNVAIIAHVDHGKTSMVDQLLRQSGTGVTSDRVMDNNQLEKERGITILAKNTSIMWKGTQINIVDTRMSKLSGVIVYKKYKKILLMIFLFLFSFSFFLFLFFNFLFLFSFFIFLFSSPQLVTEILEEKWNVCLVWLTEYVCWWTPMRVP